MQHLRTLTLVVFFLSGCGASAASEPGATETPETPEQAALQLTCAGDPPSEFAPLPRHCSADADCVVVRHRLDCCGSYTQVGIRADERAAFDAAEAACEPTVAMCRCMSRPDVASDGTFQQEGLVLNVRCVDQACETSFGQP